MSTVDGNRPRDGRTPAHETRHDLDGPAAISQTVIEAVAAAEGVDPTDCDLELYEAVDLEALDALFDRRSRDGRWRFEFSIDDYLVVVAGDGNVTVCENVTTSGDPHSRSTDASEGPNESETAGTPEN
jgi:hypothetical protein